MCKFSVLISVYYKETPEFFEQALYSVFNQTQQPTEVVIVKDGVLTPALDEVLDFFYKKYPAQIKIVALSENGGLGNALNKGLDECSYELVARMDSDDICVPDRFEKLLKAVELHPEAHVIGSWIDEFIGSQDNVVSVRKLPENHKEIVEYSKYRSPLNHVSVMFKKSEVLKSGSYQDFPLMEDYYLWIRMLSNGAIFYNLQESLVLVRNSNDMYNRRGGLKYAKTEVRFFNYMYKIHYIGLFLLITNICIRFTMRAIPNQLRKQIYLKTLR